MCCDLASLDVALPDLHSDLCGGVPELAEGSWVSLARQVYLTTAREGDGRVALWGIALHGGLRTQRFHACRRLVGGRRLGAWRSSEASPRFSLNMALPRGCSGYVSPSNIRGWGCSALSRNRLGSGKTLRSYRLIGWDRHLLASPVMARFSYCVSIRSQSRLHHDSWTICGSPE